MELSWVQWLKCLFHFLSGGTFELILALRLAAGLVSARPDRASVAKNPSQSSARLSRGPLGVSGKNSELRAGVLGVRLKGDEGRRREPEAVPRRAKPALIDRGQEIGGND